MQLIEVTDLVNDPGITDLTLITKESLQNAMQEAGLVGDAYLIRTDPDGNILDDDFTITVKYVPENQIIQANGDINLLTVESITEVSLDYTVNGDAFIKIAVSNDSGKTWKTNIGGSWVTLSNLDEDLKQNGIDPANINNISEENWKELLESNVLRFSYGIYYQNATDSAIIKTLTLKLKYEGVWNSCVLGTDYKYARGTDFIELKLLKAGSYLINYEK